MYQFVIVIITQIPWFESADEQNKPFLEIIFMILQFRSITDLNHIIWGLFIAYIVSLIIVYFQGVGTSGKIAIVTATSPYILLVIQLIRGLMLEGSNEGIYYLFKPDLVKLFNPSVWVVAANQVIIQMNVGLAILCLYGSYRKKDDNLPNLSYAKPLLTALFIMPAGLVILQLPVYMRKIISPDFTFVLYPAILDQIQMPNLWCIVFFFLIDIQFGFVDGIAGRIEDIYLQQVKVLKNKLTLQQVRLCVCSILGEIGLIFCTDIGFYLLSFVDTC